MKALSIRQPWAWAILHGGKTVENRTWKTNFRGEFLIHAGKTFDKDGYKWLIYQFMFNQILFPDMKDIPPNNLPMGGIVGKARIVDCVQSHPSPFFFGPYGFVLADTQPVDFVPCKGKLKFFKVDHPK